MKYCKRAVSKLNSSLSLDNKRNPLESTFKDDSLFQVYNYEYEEYSLDELVLLAKYDKNALEELQLRISPSLVSFTNAVCLQNKYLNFTECYIIFKKISLKAVRIFDPSFQNPFIHLLRAMLKLEAKNIEKKEAIRYTREKNALGTRVSEETLYMFDSGCQENDELQNLLLELDIDEFLETLKPKQKEIFILYYHQCSYQQIANDLHMPASTVAYWIRKILSLARKFFKS